MALDTGGAAAHEMQCLLYISLLMCLTSMIIHRVILTGFIVSAVVLIIGLVYSTIWRRDRDPPTVSGILARVGIDFLSAIVGVLGFCLALLWFAITLRFSTQAILSILVGTSFSYIIAHFILSYASFLTVFGLVRSIMNLFSIPIALATAR